jgi:hypothetical protein
MIACPVLQGVPGAAILNYRIGTCDAASRVQSNACLVCQHHVLCAGLGCGEASVVCVSA